MRKEGAVLENNESGVRSSTFSKIYGDRAVGFCQSKRKGSSTRRELRVGTRIWGLCQTPRGRGFLLLD